MARATIGILTTERISLIPYQQRVYNFGTPRLIQFYDRQGMLDALIIPDGISAYVGMACFSRNPITTLQLQNYCPQAENFRLSSTGLEYYINRQIPIVGVGDGRVMLWNQLGNQCVVEGTSIYLLPASNAHTITVDSGDTVGEFQSGNFYGVKSLQSPVLMDLLSTLKRVVTAPRDWSEKDSGEETISLEIPE